MPGLLVPVFSFLREVYRIPSTVRCEILRPCEVSNDAKHSLLPLSRSTSDSGEKLMEELSRIDPWAASQFGLKNLALQDFVMRLLYESSTQRALPQVDSPSFIILSYTWHNSEWTPHTSLGCPSNDTQLPLTPVMWSAFLSQRLSPSEGFWCDQLCIEQNSTHEKESAIGAMDLLYKSARKVVVALEDIAITKEEMDVLVDKDPYRHDLQSPQEKERIASAFGKIVRARWFRRAWCLHEFLVSRNHTFLVPVRGEVGNEEVTVVRLDALFLEAMVETFVRVELQGLSTSRRTSFTTSVSLNEDLVRLNRFILRLRGLSMAEVFQTELSYDDGSYMHMFTEIFSLGAFVISDKISILLNVMNSGLYYSGSMSLMEEDCLHLATIVALASGDPTALTTTGGPIHSPNRKRENQWLRLPVLIDTTRVMGKASLPKIGTDLSMTDQGLQLAMQFVCTSADVAAAECRYLSLSTLLIDRRAMCNSSLWGEESHLLLDHEDEDESYKGTRVYHIQALACALQLGVDWIIQINTNLFANLPGMDVGMEDGLKQDFKDAVNWALSLDESTLTSSILSIETQRWYSILLHFADKLVFAGLAATNDKSTRAAAYTNTDFAVQILHPSNAGVHQFVVFSPVCDQSEPDSLKFCMPEVLANEEYRNLSRLWILKECREDDRGRKFELVSKTRLLGTADAPKGVRMGKVVIVG